MKWRGMRLKKREDESSFSQALCVTAVRSVVPEYHFFHARSGSVSSDGLCPRPRKLCVILELSSQRGWRIRVSLLLF